MSQTDFEKFKPLLTRIFALLFVGFGFYKVLFYAFAHPRGYDIDRMFMVQIGLGLFYVLCGLYMLVERAQFAQVALIFFICFFLEISQIAAY